MADRKKKKQLRAATSRWNGEHMRSVTCCLRRETAEQFEEYAKKKGLTRHVILKSYVEYLLTGADDGGPVALRPDTLLPVRLDVSPRPVEPDEPMDD